MRVYLPATNALLRQLVDTGEFGVAPVTGFAVTPGLREWYGDEEDLEELEYAALNEAARGSLRLLDSDPFAWRRRAVVVAEVADAAVTVRDDLDRGVVQLATAPRLAELASVHVDDADAEATVGRAATAMLQADLGDEHAQELVDDAEGFELSWYATQEISSLLELG
jgi:hypothetical protein